MPKKSFKTFNGHRNSNGRSDSKPWLGHDDRDVRMEDVSPNRPKVSFKTGPRIGRDRPKFDPSRLRLGAAEFVSRASNFDGSQRITGRDGGRSVGGPGKFNPIAHRGPRLPGRIPRRGSPLLSGDDWFRVIIPFGNKYGKEFIITNLSTFIAPDTFVPIMFTISDREAMFFVDDYKTANKLSNCDQKITAADGYKMIVKVRSGYPKCVIDNTFKEKLKLAMAKRYVQETNALDLTRFHHDPELVEKYFAALSMPSVLMSVLDIVGEAIPELEALNLDNNLLKIIERLNVLKKKFPNLKILYIGNNKIKDIHQLDVMKDLKLEELKLVGNPVCNKYTNRREEYVSDVRKRFPTLLRLDGEVLPKPILFDVGDDSKKLPPSEQIFSVNPQAREIANQFMQQYFTIFDSDSRQPLLDAYHEQACFSLTLWASSTAAYHKFSTYQSNNRNLLKVDPAKRKKQLKQGRLPVVSYIAEMPKTQHYLNSFTMDIHLVTETMMLITITGCFKERDTKEQSIRYFDRAFTIVAEGSGYCISNEQLHLADPTPAQLKALTQPIVPAQPPPAAVEPSDDIKESMVLTLSQNTTMNLEWSLKCLQEVQWKYEEALTAFNNLNAQGKIPPEAFQK